MEESNLGSVTGTQLAQNYLAESQIKYQQNLEEKDEELARKQFEIIETQKQIDEQRATNNLLMQEQKQYEEEERRLNHKIKNINE